MVSDLSIKVKLKAPGIEELPEVKEVTLKGGTTLHDLLSQLRAEFGNVVDQGFVAVNSEVIRRDRIVETRLNDGDEILLIPPLALG